MSNDKYSQLHSKSRTIKDLLSIPTGLPVWERDVLARHILKLSPEAMFLENEKLIDESTFELLDQLVKKRISGVPLSYITGLRGFYGHDFLVNESVLIPRPETELLIDLVLDFVSDHDRTAYSFLDIGTGSGNIIVTLAKQIGSSNVPHGFYAVDISRSALNVAIENTQRHDVTDLIVFSESDLLASVSESDNPFSKPLPVIVVANLPYVDLDKKDFLQSQSYGSELTHEPDTALWAADSGLELYKKLLVEVGSIRRSLTVTNATYCFFEIDPSQKNMLYQYLENHTDAQDIRFTKDIAGHYRVCGFRF